MAKFNVGDKVVCTSEPRFVIMTGVAMVVGDVYEVESVGVSESDIIGLKHFSQPFKDSHFKLFVDTPLKPFYNDYIILDTLTRIEMVKRIIEDNLSHLSLSDIFAKDVMLAQGHLENAYNKIAALQKKD